MISKGLVLSSVVGLSIFFSGCSNRLGNMTLVSTNNVDGLKAEVTSKDRVSGQSCQQFFLFIPWGDFENRLQIATDHAIDNGRSAGLKGDTLINAKIDVTSLSALVYSKNCVVVNGDLIQLNDSMKK